MPNKFQVFCFAKFIILGIRAIFASTCFHVARKILVTFATFAAFSRAFFDFQVFSFAKFVILAILAIFASMCFTLWIKILVTFAMFAAFSRAFFAFSPFKSFLLLNLLFLLFFRYLPLGCCQNLLAKFCYSLQSWTYLVCSYGHFTRSFAFIFLH